MNALVVFDDGRWLRITGSEVTTRGDQMATALPMHEGEVVVGVVPGHEVAIKSLALPDLADAQARAAARLAIAETSIAPFEALHVATTDADPDGMRIVVSVEASRVTERLLSLAQAGLDPDHLLAAPLLLPMPEQGFVSGDMGDGVMVRGQGAAFPDDAVLTPLLTGGNVPQALDRAALEAALVGAVADPQADLRTGVFAKRHRWAVDHARIRQLAVLVLVLGLLVLAVQFVAILRINARAAAIEADTKVRAAALLPPGTTVTDPVVQVEARLATMGAGGAGYRPLAATLAAAVNAVPNAELGSLMFDGTGGLRATVRGATAGDIDAVQARLVSSGLTVDPGILIANQGRPYRDIMVRAR